MSINIKGKFINKGMVHFEAPEYISQLLETNEVITVKIRNKYYEIREIKPKLLK